MEGILFRKMLEALWDCLAILEDEDKASKSKGGKGGQYSRMVERLKRLIQEAEKEVVL